MDESKALADGLPELLDESKLLADQLALLYTDLHDAAYSGGGAPETKVHLSGSNPTFDIAIDKGAEALRSQLRRAAHEIARMLECARAAQRVLEDATSSSGELLAHARGVFRWTEGDVRDVESRRREANGRS